MKIDSLFRKIQFVINFFRVTCVIITINAKNQLKLADLINLYNNKKTLEWDGEMRNVKLSKIFPEVSIFSPLIRRKNAKFWIRDEADCEENSKRPLLRDPGTPIKKKPSLKQSGLN